MKCEILDKYKLSTTKLYIFIVEAILKYWQKNNKKFIKNYINNLTYEKLLNYATNKLKNKYEYIDDLKKRYFQVREIKKSILNYIDYKNHNHINQILNYKNIDYRDCIYIYDTLNKSNKYSNIDIQYSKNKYKLLLTKKDAFNNDY